MIRFSANLSLLFRELPLLERFAAARAAGFGAAEIQVPYELPAATLAAAARAADLPVVLINAPLGPQGAPGMACRREHRALFRAGLVRAAEYAHALGAPCVNVLAGPAAPQERAACLEQLAEGLSHAAEALGAAGARPLLEPINPLDVPSYCVASFELAAATLARCDSRVALQFDVYHAARMGLDPAAAFTAMHALTAHVQFADSPGRHEPGCGALSFEHIFAAIESSGYQGWTGAEYHPSTPDTRASLGWLTR